MSERTGRDGARHARSRAQSAGQVTRHPAHEPVGHASFSEHEMDRSALGELSRDPVVGLEAAQIVPEPDAAPEEYRCDGDVELVDEAGLEEVAHRGGPAADPDVLAVSGGNGAVEQFPRA